MPKARECPSGYFVIEVPNLDPAMAWAERRPTMRYGELEIRASPMGSA